VPSLSDLLKTWTEPCLAVPPRLTRLTDGIHIETALSADATLTLPTGLNFLRQDYLALTRLPQSRRAPSATFGQSDALAKRLAGFLGMPTARCHFSGSAAIGAAFQGLLAPEDQIIVDAGAPALMVAAAQATGARVHLTPSGSVDGVERRLHRLSREARKGRLFVAVSAVAPYTSVTADLAELQQLCATYGALLIVDVSHDLGATAPTGRGMMELHGCLGQIDVVLGSFAKCLGAPGGFVALRDLALADRLAPSAPLSDENATMILAGLALIESPEGRRRRRCLHGSILRLRNHLMADGLRVLGQPSPIVPVALPHGSAQAMTTLLRSAGPAVQLLGPPLVARHAPRWRILLTSDHGPANIDDLAELIHDLCRSFARSHRSARQPQPMRLKA
jgi:7-keto-8-aminopelargonate synthetase-like enzyme